MKNYFVRLENFVLVSSVLLFSDAAFANRLQAAAEKGKSTVMIAAQTGSVIGIVVGGLLMTIGATQIGKQVLISGVIGAFAIFGGPALIEVIRSVFGT